VVLACLDGGGGGGGGEEGWQAMTTNARNSTPVLATNEIFFLCARTANDNNLTGVYACVGCSCGVMGYVTSGAFSALLFDGSFGTGKP
jgi:hypothetical protein